KRFQLTKNLGLSQNHRVERARNPEDMTDRLIVVVAVKLPGEVLAGQTTGFAQKRFESLQSFGLFFNPGKKFDSIAGGKDYHLLDSRTSRHAAKSFRQGRFFEGGKLTRLQPGGPVIESNQEEVQIELPEEDLRRRSCERSSAEVVSNRVAAPTQTA